MISLWFYSTNSLIAFAISWDIIVTISFNTLGKVSYSSFSLFKIADSKSLSSKSTIWFLQEVTSKDLIYCFKFNFINNIL